MSVLKFASVMVLIGLMCGCETPPVKPLVLDLDLTAETLVKKMCAHPNFARSYAKIKAAKAQGAADVVPLICNYPIENLTSVAANRPRGRELDGYVKDHLLDAGLFDILASENSDAIMARIVENMEGGLEAGTLGGTFKQGEDPDLIVLGVIREVTDENGCVTAQLRLSLHDLRTRKLVWTGKQNFIYR